MLLFRSVVLLLLQLYAFHAWSAEQNGTLDSVVAGIISHDTVYGRMRVDMVENPFGEPGVVSYIGAVSRDLTGLLRNKNYELNFRFYEGANPLRRVQVLVIPGSLFAMGILDPSGYRIADSLGISNNLSLRFLAGESSMAIVIIGESRISGNYYFIDDFTVYESREEQKTSPNRAQYAEREGYRFGFGGHEKNDEIKGSGNHLSFGDYGYDPRTGRRWNLDPIEQEYISGYAVFNNSPIYFNDPDGREPIKPQAGTATGFVNTINTTGTKLGLKTGLSAHTAMLGLGKTEFHIKNGRPMPVNTQRINTFSDKYIYTEKGGWIDMAHFMFYAGRAYDVKVKKEEALKRIETNKKAGSHYIPTPVWHASKKDPVGEAIQEGYHQEMSDRTFAKHSAYSYEDLPSDYFGADFGANYFDPNSKLTFGEQLQNYLNNLGATDPKNAPNYNSLPNVEPDKKPSRTNHTTKPVYTKDSP
ncbi:MAG: hypothetical protein M9887_08660 [Chitinophagales bacterium]|nr:hypothetical protein [Chitinophagales bacterium]